MANHEVISAFLDGESFDSNALASALAEPGGRELLLDLIALRAVVQEEAPATAPAVDACSLTRQRRLWVAAGFAAATLLFSVGGALAMKELRPASTPTALEADVPPHPDRVVTFEPGLEWHDLNR